MNDIWNKINSKNLKWAVKVKYELQNNKNIRNLILKTIKLK